MSWFCAHCSNKIKGTEIEDYDTGKRYCGRTCFNQRPRRRPLEYPVCFDEDDLAQYRALHPPKFKIG